MGHPESNKVTIQQVKKFMVKESHYCTDAYVSTEEIEKIESITGLFHMCKKVISYSSFLFWGPSSIP